MKQTLGAALLIGYVIALAGCNCNPPQEVPDAELVGPLWILESVEPVGATAIKPDPTRTYTIQFFEDSTLVGVADCDDISGEYFTQDGRPIRFGNGGATKRGCAEADPPINKYYPTAFVRTINIYYEINGNKLSLHVKNLITASDEANLNFETSD